jgi:Trypsin-like peptidase domain
MPKRFQIAGLIIVFLALCGYLGWKAIFASGPLPNTAEYQDRLKLTAANITAPVDAQDPDDSLKVYAVDVAHTAPFDKPFVGYGIYLGHGAIITAAHVVGHWPFFTNTRVLIAGQDLPAKVVKEGTVALIDLALLSVDETRLPVSLRLRRNPLCEGAIRIGTNVAVVTPQDVARSRIASPQLILPKYRLRFNTLISEPRDSGSGVFDIRRRCLLGIVSRKIEKFGHREVKGRIVLQKMGFAGYFVSASKIARFIPPDFHF